MKWILSLPLIIAHCLGTVVVSADWVETCRTNGFDPTVLACSTCQQLFAAFDHSKYRACISCCQSVLDTKTITKPYQTAVLVLQGEGGGQEWQEFLQHDWDELVQTKTSKRLFKVHNTDDPPSDGYFSFRMTTTPSVVLFFDQSVSSSTNVATLRKLASDRYTLDSMKRDDIADMLRTLLP